MRNLGFSIFFKELKVSLVNEVQALYISSYIVIRKIFKNVMIVDYIFSSRAKSSNINCIKKSLPEGNIPLLGPLFEEICNMILKEDLMMLHATVVVHELPTSEQFWSMERMRMDFLAISSKVQRVTIAQQNFMLWINKCYLWIEIDICIYY